MLDWGAQRRKMRIVLHTHMTPLSLEPVPDLDSLPWACVREVGLPATSFGKPVEWDPGYVPQPVFIGRCAVPSCGELLVFGVRYDFVRRTVPEPGKGYFVRYVVVQPAGDGPVAHVLGQQRSTTYQSLEETGDSVFASDIKKKDLLVLCLTEAPRWKAGSAQWPLLAATPMHFVAQFALQESELTPTGSNLLDGRFAVFAYVVDNADLLGELVATGLPARVIQHENDHLDGIIFFDRMKSLETLAFMDEFRRYWSKDDE